MAIDPGISDSNGCIFMTPGPGGNWWLSPDVIMEGADPSTAAAGPDTTDVTVHWKANCSLSGELTAVIFELYVGDPSLVMTPINTVQLQAPTQVAGLAAGGAVKSTVPWTPDTDPTKPNGPGHKCLIARAYPFGSTPDTGQLSIYLPDDPHYAQHNLTVQGVGGKEGKARIRVNTGNPREQAEVATILVLADTQPNAAVLAAIMPSLNAFPGFTTVASKPVKSMQLDLGSLGQVVPPGDTDDAHEKKGFFEKVEDAARAVAGGIAKAADAVEDAFEGPDKKVQGKVLIDGNSFGSFDFVVDPSGGNPGEAYICHMTQTTADGKPCGGLTVVVVVL